MTFNRLSREQLEGQSLAVAPVEKSKSSLENNYNSPNVQAAQKTTDVQAAKSDEWFDVNIDFFSQGQPQGIAPPAFFNVKICIWSVIVDLFLYYVGLTGLFSPNQYIFAC
ncbi:MAG: hypothetical protein ABIV51_08700 [Saprospiraceae bacterium]